MKITDPKWRTFKRNKKKLSVIESAEYDFARVWINAGEKPNLISILDKYYELLKFIQ